jgi:hypothetical protein
LGVEVGFEPEPVDEAGVACTPVLTEVLVTLVVVAVCNGPPGLLVTLIVIAALSVASSMLVKTPPVIDAGAEPRIWTFMAAFV